MNRFGRLRDYLRPSFWFVPSLTVGGSVVLAAALIEMDSAGTDEWFAQWPRRFGAGADGARAMMSTIASSMMTVVSVTFSMILVVLALASSQYTSRVLRKFIGALQTIASLTASPSRRRAPREQAQWLAELAERSVESSHDRSRIDARPTRVREALEGKPESARAQTERSINRRRSNRMHPADVNSSASGLVQGLGQERADEGASIHRAPMRT